MSRTRRTALRLWAVLPAVLPLLLSCKGEIRSPAATVEGVAPAVVCAVQKTTAITVTGTQFTPLPTRALTDSPALELPQIFLALRTQYDGTAGSAPELRLYDDPAMSHVSWQSSAQMSFDVYPGMVLSDYDLGSLGADLPTGLYDVIVQNPDGVRATRESALTVVPPPKLAAVTPNPACNEQAESSFTLTGTNFIVLDGQRPTVTFTAADGSGQPVTATTTASASCAAVPSPTGVMVMACTELTVTVPQAALPVTSYKVAVTNPGSANCVTQEDVRTAIIPAPVVTSATTLAVCSIADTTLQLVGQNFLRINKPSALNPTVSVNGKQFPTTLDNCMPIVDAPDAELCTTVNFTIPSGAIAASGSFPATITNPGQDACSTSMMITIDVVGVPTITNAAPKIICSGGGDITITGTNLYSGGTALIQGIAASRYSATNSTSAVATFSGPLPVGGPYPLTVRNQLGCEATLPAAMGITVSPGPAILFVDPPAIPNVTTIQATVYATGVSPPIKTISIAPAGTATYTNLTLTTNALFPNRAVVTIPAGLAAGRYDMRLDDQSTCSAFLPQALRVVSQATLTVTSVTPGFGSAAVDTGVVIAGTGFVSTPRAYLSASNGTGQALALAAVTFQSATSLSAVVRSGLPAGQYDLIVVNPDGSYGIKKMAYTVTPVASPPPIVTSIAPSSFVTGSPTASTISGSGFRTGATLTVSCQDAAGVAVAGGTGTVTAVTATAITATITGTGILCIVRVTNQDGTYFDYSAIGVTNASLNLTGFKNGTNLITGRRALGAAAGRPTPVARFVYAIGGDNGADNQPTSTVEAAPTALNGDLGAWFRLPTSLPKALSFQGIGLIGRFLYAVGGFDGAAAVKDVYRSEILNPLAAPQVTDADVRYSAVTGLSAGIYTYRVAAVMSAADPNNPNGETLASDFFPIQLPAAGQGAGKLQVILFWSTVPNAASYRIYRSPKANDAAGKELLVGSVLATAMPLRFVDDGTVTPAGAAPLPLGSTGTWRQIVSLNTARIAPGVGVAQDPVDATKWYVYAVGGNSSTPASPTAVNSVEFLPVTVMNNGAAQNFTTWTAATSTLGKARWALAALPATGANNSVVMSAVDTYLYAASGSTSSLTNLDGLIEVAKVQAGGQLAAFADARTAGTGIKRPGYGGALVNNQVMAFGGFQGGAAANQSDTGTLSSATTVGNFNALGNGTLKFPRALQGTAIESAFVYQLGGASAGVNTAQNTTEQTIW